MKLYCKAGVVIATHDDAQDVPASAYGDGTTIMIADHAVDPGTAVADLPPVDLPTLKQRLKAQIDAAAEVERLKYITPGAGQAMTYARKVEQARAVQAATDSQPSAYPLLAASIGIDGADLQAVAAKILAMDAAWEQIGAAIEQTRLVAKHGIDLAEDAEAARAVSVIWPNPEI